MNETQRVCGALPEIEPIRMYNYETACGAVKATSYPVEFMIDTKYLGVLKDQGMVGACVGCVVSSLAEVLELIEQTKGSNLSDYEFKKLEGQYEFSEGWAYGALRDDGYKGYGMYPASTLKSWSKRGVVPKKYFNYLEEVPNILTTVNKFPELKTKAEPYKINSYISLNSSTLYYRDISIKNFLTTYGYGLLAVSNTFFGGSHCIMLVGWNDKTNCYKVKNSWGNGWGDEKGVEEIPKSAINSVYGVLDKELSLPFTDVQSTDWFYKEVKNVFYAGLMQGITNKEFAPQKETTRGEMAIIIERIINLTFERIELALKVGNESYPINVEAIMSTLKTVSPKIFPFIDVAPDSWYYRSINNCCTWGLLNGKSSTLFAPEDSITRAEVAVLCVRTCNFIIDKLQKALQGCNKLKLSHTHTLNALETAATPDYNDVLKTDWYCKEVDKVYQLNIMRGTSEKTFEPNRNVTRAEIATVLNRLVKYIDIKNNVLIDIF